MAIGIFVVPELKEFQNPDIAGKKYPIMTPANITRNIQRVRNRSKKERRFTVFMRENLRI
jgi:hypothetical protein